MIAGIHHATFLSGDLVKARAFYEGVLGLRPAARPQMSCDGMWYDIAQQQQIHLMALPDPTAGLPRPAHGGRDRHLALLVKDMAQLLAKLDAAGIVYTPSQSGRRAVFCRDPDGNALEFIEVAA